MSLTPASLSDLQSITSFILFCFSCLSHLPFTDLFLADKDRKEKNTVKNAKTVFHLKG